MGLYWSISFVLLIALVFVAIALLPKGDAKVGLSQGKLSACPGTPNCVCSEYESSAFYITPFTIQGPSDKAWQQLKRLALSAGGTVHEESQSYLWVSFTSKWLRFTDDVEFRIDAERNMIHVRSASRIGRSDFGVNRQRIEALRMQYLSKLPSVS